MDYATTDDAMSALVSENSYLRGINSDLLAALESYVLQATTTGWTPGDRNACLNQAKAAISKALGEKP